MAGVTEEHKQQAQQVVAQFIDDGQSILPGALPIALRDAIATALANVEAAGDEKPDEEIRRFRDGVRDKSITKLYGVVLLMIAEIAVLGIAIWGLVKFG